MNRLNLHENLEAIYIDIHLHHDKIARSLNIYQIRVSYIIDHHISAKCHKLQDKLLVAY